MFLPSFVSANLISLFAHVKKNQWQEDSITNFQKFLIAFNSKEPLIPSPIHLIKYSLRYFLLATKSVVKSVVK